MRTEKENKESATGLFISGIHSIAKYNPEQLELILTDYNLELAIKDLDNKMAKSYTAYLKNKHRVLLDPKSSGLQKALMQLNGAELLMNYILYQVYDSIAKNRNLTIETKSNIMDIDRIYKSDGPKLIKK